MTSLQKEALYIKWNLCGRDTRIRLACEYSKLIRLGGKDISWLYFLENNLEKKLVFLPKHLTFLPAYQRLFKQ